MAVIDMKTKQNREEETDTRDYERELRRHRVRRAWIIIVAIVVVVVAIVIICLAQRKSTYSKYVVTESVRRSDAGAAEYIYVGQNLYRCSKDGVEAFDEKGHTLWNASYEVSNLYISSCGEYFAVADLNGNSVHLFNAEGALGSINSAEPIVQVSVASAGYVAVTVEDDGADYIHMYQMDGEHAKIYTIKKSISIDGLPVAICISPDGAKLASAYTGVVKGSMDTQLVFSNFDAVGQNENERVVGGFDFGEELIGRIEFLTDKMVGVYAEHSLSFYRIKEYPELVTRVEIPYEIQYVFSSDAYVGLIHRDSESGKDVIEIYDTAGKQVLSWKVIYDDLAHYQMDKNTLVANGDHHMVIVDFSGKEIFNHSFDEDIVELFPIGKDEEFIYINSNYVQYIKLD